MAENTPENTREKPPLWYQNIYKGFNELKSLFNWLWLFLWPYRAKNIFSTSSIQPKLFNLWLLFLNYIHVVNNGIPKLDYRVSQKLVPLNSRTITFDQNYIFTWNCWKMFISPLSTCIQNFSYWHALFVFLITFFSRRCMKWDTACRPTDDPFWAFLSPGAQGPVQPPSNICLV